MPIPAQVSGTDVYFVSVVRDAHGDFNLFCTCPYAEGDVLREAVRTDRLVAAST